VKTAGEVLILMELRRHQGKGRKGSATSITVDKGRGRSGGSRVGGAISIRRTVFFKSFKRQGKKENDSWGDHEPGVKMTDSEA